MLTSITPLGERGRGNRYGVTMTAYVLGSVLGGSLTGALLGALGSLLPLSSTTALVLAAVVCLVAAVADATGRVPSYRRQVDEDWLTRYRGWVYGAGFGFQLGTGLVTIVTSALTYAALALALLTGSAAAGAAVGVAFALTRAVPAVAARGVDTPDALRALASWLERRLPLARRLSVAVLATAAVALGAVAL
jgi:sulfite exporter TauE/SafE